MNITLKIDGKVLMLVVLVVVIGGVSLGVQGVSSSTAAPASMTLGSIGTPNYDSGWQIIPATDTLTLAHNLGTTDLFVYMMGGYSGTDPPWYSHQQGFGGEIVYGPSSDWMTSGAWWRTKNNNEIQLWRGDVDNVWDYVRVLIWKIESPTSALVVRGMNNGIYYRLFQAGVWGAWTRLPGGTPHTPASTLRGNELHIVVTGMDNQLYHGDVNLDTGVFSGWTGIGGASPDAPEFS